MMRISTASGGEPFMNVLLRAFAENAGGKKVPDINNKVVPELKAEKDIFDFILESDFRKGLMKLTPAKIPGSEAEIPPETGEPTPEALLQSNAEEDLLSFNILV